MSLEFGCHSPAERIGRGLLTMEAKSMPSVESTPPPTWFKNAKAEVVEISLMLPVQRAEALVRLSRNRQTSVAQLLRDLIDDALSVAD